MIIDELCSISTTPIGMTNDDSSKIFKRADPVNTKLPSICTSEESREISTFSRNSMCPFRILPFVRSTLTTELEKDKYLRIAGFGLCATKFPVETTKELRCILKDPWSLIRTFPLSTVILESSMRISASFWACIVPETSKTHCSKKTAQLSLAWKFPLLIVIVDSLKCVVASPKNSNCPTRLIGERRKVTEDSSPNCKSPSVISNAVSVNDTLVSPRKLTLPM
mmetsp:Transcript_14096/g.17783  ORF Transcript_14096/g.17783 Transcript_14096/m.17783 type:complete len:223 (+) Transcript_14096:157-825(+)